jgi:thioredoxin 1
MEKITTQELEQLKLSGEKILVDFYGTWCGPCRMLFPILEQLSTDFPNVKFVKIDVDQNREGSMDYGIRGVPTVLIFNGTTELSRTSGVRPDQFYKDVLNTL